MTSFTVTTGTNDTKAKTLANDDTGLVQEGATLSAATAITWTGISTVPGAMLENAGTINATTRGIDTSGNFSTGSFTFDNDATGILNSANDAFRINTNIITGTIALDNLGSITSSTGQALDFAAITSATANIDIDNGAGGIIKSLGDDAIRPGSGNIIIVNDGLIDATASASRAINLSDGTLANLTSFSLTNHVDGTIQSQGDTIRITASTLATTATYNVTLDNAGTIESTGVGASNGQAIDFNDLVATSGHVTITNEATGLIEAADADAVRAGTNGVVNNYGRIVSMSVNGDTGNDGLDFQSNTGGLVNNYAGGSIEGARHGITGDNPVTVENWGTITGDLGSGINIDSQPATVTTVDNWGTITGTGTAATDGDGIDVDGLVAITNHGTITTVGIETGDLNEALAIGGGTVTNYAGGTISSVQRAITVDDSNLGNAFGATTIDNQGLIQGGNGEAISITDTFADTLTNSGTIVGSVAMGGGDDTVNLYTGSTMSGLLDGGEGNDTINLLGTTTGTLSNVANVEMLNVHGGAWTIIDDQSFSGGTIIDANASLALGNGGMAGSLAGAIEDNGTLLLDRSDVFAVGGSISGNGEVVQEGSGTAELGGDNSYTGGTLIESGSLDIALADSAGTGAVTFAATGETLSLEAAASVAFANTIAGFDAGETIDLAGIGVAASAVLGAGNVLTVTGGANGAVTLNLDTAHNYAGDVFLLADDGHGGTDITVDDAPVITSPAAFAIPENTTAVGMVATSDANPVMFSIDGGDDASFFAINAQTGALSFVTAPDFETPADANHDNVYDVIIEVQDKFGAFTTEDLSVTVTDVVEIGKTFNGGNGNDTIAGTTGDDVINGGNGNDHLNGNDGNDTVSGGDGNDVLTGGRGNDTMDGGDGNDSLDGGVGNNHLTGGDGNDTLTAADGNNVLDGGDGNDTLSVTGGTATLSGGDGNDVLKVGTADATLTGGDGNDTFVFGPGFGRDVITDFSHGDKIDFTGGVFHDFHAMLADAHQSGADTIIMIDPTHEITLSHVSLASLSANEFVFG